MPFLPTPPPPPSKGGLGVGELGESQAKGHGRILLLDKISFLQGVVSEGWEGTVGSGMGQGQ